MICYIVQLPAVMMVMMALVMLIMIRILSNAAIESDIKNDIRYGLVDNVRNLMVENGELKISENFYPHKDNIHYYIINRQGTILIGSYPEEIKEQFSRLQAKVGFSRGVICNGDKYYVRDRRVRRKVKSNIYLRAIVKKLDTDSHYRMMERIVYVCIIGMIGLILTCEMFLYKKVSKELDEMCKTAESIGSNLEISKRMKGNNRFAEIEVLVQANNRMLDRMEHTFRQQEQFTSDVAHELRTPVAVVLAQCQYAREKGWESKEEISEMLAVIHKQSDRMSAMITQLLNFSRLDQDRVQLEDETVDLVEIAESVCEMEQEKAENGVSIHLQLKDAMTRGDIGLIVIVVSNLVSNAVKFSAQNGRVEVRTGESEKEAYISVTDYGIGIPEKDLENIFHRFYQCDQSRSAEGFGLGLALSEKIAQKHGGKITVSSKMGHGSAFTLYLPKK